MPPLGRPTSFCHVQRQLVAPEAATARAAPLSLVHKRQQKCLWRRHARRSMERAATAQPEEYQLLVTSTDERGLEALRRSFSQEDALMASGASVLPCFEVDSMQPQPQFDAAAFMRHLGTAQLGQTLLSAAQLPSTQTLLQDVARQIPDGTVCVADVQSGGKGRGRNVWTSPRGCLMFSALIRLKMSGSRLPFVQYVASLAVLQAIQAEAGKLLGDPSQKLDVRIKWPNDLYAGPHKLGGILCQSVYRDQQFQVIIGVGLNLSNEQPSTCINAMLREQQRQCSPELTTSPAVTPEALLATTLSLLERHVQTLQTEGFKPIEAAYTDSWLHTGQQVTWKGEEGERDVSMRIQGLTPDGYLLAADDGGERYSLSPDGNSLDFFQGLIRSKLPR